MYSKKLGTKGDCPKGYCVRDDWVWDKEIDV